MKILRTLLIIGVVIAFVAINLIFFTVDTTEYAIVTQFGNPVRAITQPGLYLKLPDPVESVQTINNQLQIYNLPQIELLTQDKKNIVIEAYATWRVTDPLQFLKAVSDVGGAETRLADILASEMGVALGQVPLNELVTTEAETMQLPDMLAAVTQATAGRADPYGFTITDVRLRLLTFPEANQASVFQRMRAEREAIARQFRSEGTEQAAIIRAKADTEKATLLAEAEQQAQTIRGEADAESIRIYAEAFGQDAEFYRFLRTLESYKAFADEDTTLVLPMDSPLLQYLNPPGSLKEPQVTTDQSVGETTANR
ncbi:MAG: protease modulator HflC [Anaerolineae bacterium]|nr:protease modulator HflC [Anaerolineae bacterium]